MAEELTAPVEVLDFADSALQNQNVVAAFDRLVAYRRNYGELVANLVAAVEQLGDAYAGPAVEILLCNAYHQSKLPIDPDQAVVLDKGFDEPYPMVGFDQPVVGVGSPAGIRHARDSAIQIFQELGVPFKRLVWTDWPDLTEEYEDRRDNTHPRGLFPFVVKGRVKLPYSVSSVLTIPGTVLVIDNLTEGDSEDYPGRPAAFRAAEVLHRLKKLYPRLPILGFMIMPDDMTVEDLLTNPYFDKLRAHNHVQGVQDAGHAVPITAECSTASSGHESPADISTDAGPGSASAG